MMRSTGLMRLAMAAIVEKVLRGDMRKNLDELGAGSVSYSLAEHTLISVNNLKPIGQHYLLPAPRPCSIRQRMPVEMIDKLDDRRAVVWVLQTP